VGDSSWDFHESPLCEPKNKWSYGILNMRVKYGDKEGPGFTPPGPQFFSPRP